MTRKLAMLALAGGALMTWHANAQLSATASRVPAVSVNSIAFAWRSPPPGGLDYFQAIRFIDNGMKYADPLSAFFVSPAGEMCFFARPNYPVAIFSGQYRYWCLYPAAVDRVETLANGGEGVGIVRLWCRYAYPQCAHRLYDPTGAGKHGDTANDIVVPTVAYEAQRAALEDLIFVMGGSARILAPVPLAPAER